MEKRAFFDANPCYNTGINIKERKTMDQFARTKLLLGEEAMEKLIECLKQGFDAKWTPLRKKMYNS